MDFWEKNVSIFMWQDSFATLRNQPKETQKKKERKEHDDLQAAWTSVD